MENKLTRQPLPCGYLIAIVITSAFILGLGLYQYNINQSVSRIEKTHDEMLSDVVSLLNRELGNTTTLLHLLHNDLSLHKALSTQLNSELLTEVFTSYAHSVENLMQIRWLDEQGQEKVRINIQNGDITVVKHENLQNKFSRDYFSKATQLRAGEIYLSDIDLNIENNQIERPFRPTLRAEIRTTRQENMIPGVLIINVDMGKLFAKLRQLHNDGLQLMVVNSQGYWLLNPNPSLEWGHSLNKPENKLSQLYPKLWTALNRTPTLYANQIHHGLYSSKLVSLNSQNLEQARITVISETPAQQLQGIKTRALLESTFYSTLLLCFGFILIYRERRYFVEIKTLSQQLATDNNKLLQAKKRLNELLEQQILLQKDLVEAGKLASLGMMVAGVSHELNTPLGSALLVANRQKQDLAQLVGHTDNASAQDYLLNAQQGIQLIINNLQSCSELVKHFKRLAIDRANEEIVTFELSDVIEDITQTLEPQLKKNHILLEKQFTPDILMASVPGILSQVIQNLIINAIDHAFATIEHRTITIGTQLKAGKVILIIADNGQGIHNSVAQSLFDPFVTTKRRNGNTGLGLHFVHQWVNEILKGTVQVNSTPEQGTCFTITIPQYLKGVPAGL